MRYANNEKWQTTRNEKSRTTKSSGLQILGILEADTIKQQEMKEKIKKEYLRRARKLLETKLYSRNLVKGINTWAVPLVRYLGPFLKWTREELKQMDQKTRKLMTIHKALHPRDDVDRLYVSRRDEGRGFAIIEDSVDTSIQRLKNYIQNNGGKLITANWNNTDTRTSGTTITRKQKWGKNNSMDILNDSQATSHTRKRGRD